MGNPGIITAFIIVLCIDAVLFMAQYAVADINPDSTLNFLSSAGTFHQQSDKGNYTLNASSYSEYMPSGIGSAPDTDTGLSIIDIFSTLRNWVTTGGALILALLGGPYFILLAIGAPSILAFSVGVVWFISNLVLLIAFVTGR